MNFYLEEHPDLIQADLENDVIDIAQSNYEIQTPNLPNKDNHNNNCFRCIEKDCYLIPYISFNKDKDNNLMFNCHCRNGHKQENIPINDYKNFLNKKLEDLLCNFCSLNKEKDKNIRLYYCYKCQKYICNLEKCNNSHEKECDNNDLIQLEKIDSYCILHGKNLIYYCEDCKISICNLCKNHESHKKTIIGEMNIKNEDKELIIKNIEKNLNDLEIIYSNLKEKLINKLSNIYEMNKNLLLLNKKIIENLNDKEMNGEIYVNVKNCKYIKEIKIQNDLDYFNNIFKQIEDYLSNEFFEFDEEKQKNKLRFWNRIPLIISFDKDVKKLLKDKKIETKKVLVNPAMTVSQFSFLIKKDMKYPDEYLIFCANSKYSVTYDRTFKEIYDQYKADDDMLYLRVFKELRWG